MEENKFIYNMKNYNYFRENIRITCLLDTLRRAVLGITIMSLVLWGIFTILDITLGIYSGKLVVLVKNPKIMGIFIILISAVIIIILILSAYSKKSLNNKYQKLHDLYLKNPVVLKKRKIYRRKRNALCVLAENLEEQKFLEKTFVKLLYENKKAEKTAYNFLAVSHGKKETKKSERFRNQMISYDETLSDYSFTFDRFKDDDENDNYVYYININGCNIKINDDEAVLAEAILFNSSDEQN